MAQAAASGKNVAATVQKVAAAQVASLIPKKTAQLVQSTTQASVEADA